MNPLNDWKQMKKTFSIALIVFIAGFCLFAVAYHQHQVRRIQDAVNEHAKVVAGSIWDLNPESSEEYLRAVAASNHYEKILVSDAEGNIFIEVKHPDVNLLEGELIRLKLIRRVRVSADIFYNREFLGKVEALWLDTSIYVYAYAFLVGLLLFAVVLLYSRILRAKATLEQKVAERTLNLTEKTDELQKSEKSYRTLAENLPGLVYRIFLKENNRMQFFNSMFEPMTGFREAEFAGGTIHSLQSWIVPEDKERTLSKVAKAIKEKVPIDAEYRFQHKSGEIRYFHERGKPVFDGDGAPLYVDGVIFDITADRETLQKQQALEEQLRQAQKLEALGALAGGITHDFNNILSAIYGYTQLALMELPEGSPARAYLNNMFDAGNRAKELVKQILTFSRLETQKQFPVEVRLIVKEALKLLRASIPATIEIRQNIAPNCGNVLANPTQIHQILMNLCINAYHAMREAGGILSVLLEPLDMAGNGDAASGLSGLRPGPYLRLEVSDTGHGMDRKTIDRIFEPYFTTKARGEGTGMGLSVVHGIVKSHDGHITVSSESGKGSTFRVYWPVIAQSAIRGESVFGESLPGGNETIMLIDDEEQTLHVEEAILNNLGYHIQAFTSPLPALERFRDQPGAFDLIVTDMTMPGMTGDKFSREVLKIRPDMPIILCTGFSETITEEKAEAIGIRAFMMKPIEIKKFAGVLRKLLDKTETTT
ncbi:MAG: ATP-binding protein [Desulfosalsimonadaceae bacterium]|nr:ATP-binding protein [Desulfosalsimonadaceae bacterium]